MCLVTVCSTGLYHGRDMFAIIVTFRGEAGPTWMLAPPGYYVCNSTEVSFLIGRPGAELEMSRTRNEENQISGPIFVFHTFSIDFNEI